ncbi:hypothetical protein GWI33_007789 [Rhynchophorus ferrugineus]|uniref:Uncharacterized protein n=1 Tax=Rhynchophorus ferrugineus TaxID=354439 RepID=A0A834MI24_RHYFE|nr:hypothetical protein GWI33_007789 [Rhynchophorus ferrugineus]
MRLVGRDDAGEDVRARPKTRSATLPGVRRERVCWGAERPTGGSVGIGEASLTGPMLAAWPGRDEIMPGRKRKKEDDKKQQKTDVLKTY